MTRETQERYVIVRAGDKRYYAGYLESILPPVVLRRCRQLCIWNAKTWFDLAVEGPTEPEECLFSSPVSKAYITEVKEVVECSAKAALAIVAIPNPIDCERCCDDD